MAAPSAQTRRATRDARRPAARRGCALCAAGVPWVDYKATDVLRRFMSDRGRVRARAASGACARHQREVTAAIKTARELGLLPYAERTLTDGSGRRGRGRARAVGAGAAAPIEHTHVVGNGVTPLPALTDEEK